MQPGEAIITITARTTVMDVRTSDVRTSGTCVVVPHLDALVSSPILCFKTSLEIHRLLVAHEMDPGEAIIRSTARPTVTDVRTSGTELIIPKIFGAVGSCYAKIVGDLPAFGLDIDWFSARQSSDPLLGLLLHS